MNLKTLYELKEVLDFCGYHDTIVEDKKKRYKSLVSWEDEQPFDIYEFLLTQDIEM